ncbi:MAG: DUF3048 domain-containing protein [Acidimicrobiales bacterium]|nr:DUF3048 domain-containing protein [Acidimicrobiales bacterium]
MTTPRRGRPAAVTAGLLAIVLVAAACSSDEAAPVATTTTVAPTTTTTAPVVRSPLTGLPAADPAGEQHPAVSVKMDNSPEARPQAGINQADVVYEMRVEGITRFALVLHSQLRDDVGPVRSARSSDIDLVAGLSTPLFVWSGGNPGVTAEVLGAAREGVLTNASFDVAEQFYYRSRERPAPHNLYVNLLPLVAERAPAGQGPPAPVFAYRVEGAAVTNPSLPVAGVSIDYGLGRVEYVWDADRGGWARYQVDARHPRPDAETRDADGVQVAPANVVVMFVDYGVSAADSRSPRAETVGEGEALVLTDGQLVRGRWVRPVREQPAQLLDETGAPILLTPGRTWVALPQTGAGVVPLDQLTADELLAEAR